MKLNSTSLPIKIFTYTNILLSSAGLSYALVNKFIKNKPHNNLLILFTCLFVVAIASWQRNKLSTKN